MKKILIIVNKNTFNIDELNSFCLQYGLSQRVKFVVGVSVPDYETTICFTPQPGFAEIAKQDFNSISNFLCN